MKTIGLIIASRRSFEIHVCSGIMDFVRHGGDWALRLLDFDEVGRSALFRRCDGFIASVINEDMARSLRASGKPTVDIFGLVGAKDFAVSEHNARLIGQMAARHFIEHRFTHFAYFGYEGIGFSDARRDAFARCLRLNHFDCDVYRGGAGDREHFTKCILRDERLLDIGSHRSIARWVKGLPKPVAIFCAHDLRAYQLIEACRENGIRVPQDVAVLGVDNDEFICNFANPSLSSIDQDGFRIGYNSAMLLAQMLTQPGRTPKSMRVRPAGLYERDSTRTYPIDPPWLSDALVFIRANVAKKLTAADVYASLGKSHSSVDRVFRTTLGSSVQKTIMASRLEEARRLVTTTSLPMSEVAERAGFASIQYFCRSFTAAFGRNPTSFR